MRRPRTTWQRDLAIAVAVTAISEIELLLARDSVTGSLTAWAMSLLIIVPALALRRARPLLSVIIAAVGFAIDPLLGEAPVATPFLALLFLLASLGWYAGTRQGLLGVGAVLTGGLSSLILSGDANAADIVVNVAVIGGTWAAGHRLRRTSDRRVRAEVEADRAARDAVVAERQRIARDLHDSMAHALTLITLQAGAARERAAGGDDQALLAGIEATGRSALADMHRFLRLVGSADEESPGVGHLPELVEGARRGGLAVDLDATLPADLPHSVSTVVYRVVQEALTNVARHSDAGRARVGIGQEDGDVVVRVTNDGLPRPTPVVGAGRGLDGLRERLRLFGGEVSAGSTADGWQLVARVPLQRA